MKNTPSHNDDIRAIFNKHGIKKLDLINTGPNVDQKSLLKQLAADVKDKRACLAEIVTWMENNAPSTGGSSLKAPWDGLGLPNDQTNIALQMDSNITMDVPGDVKSVSEKYEKAITGSGWSATVPMSAMGDTASGVYGKDGKTLTLTVMKNMMGGDGSTVTLTIS